MLFHPRVDGGIALDGAVESQQIRCPHVRRLSASGGDSPSFASGTRRDHYFYGHAGSRRCERVVQLAFADCELDFGNRRGSRFGTARQRLIPGNHIASVVGEIHKPFTRPAVSIAQLIFDLQCARN